MAGGSYTRTSTVKNRCQLTRTISSVHNPKREQKQPVGYQDLLKCGGWLAIHFVSRYSLGSVCERQRELTKLCLRSVYIGVRLLGIFGGVID